ncbi:MAG: putative bifunctional diguanylate cyclase/phosphodiesterase, partial [Steroidobacteraceae bacterium]
NQAFEDVHRHPDRTHVLVFIDLDRFKLVNDTCGHLAGDELLRQITGLLQTRVRADDSLARLGGDEFGVLLLNCAAESARNIADGMRQVIKDYAFRWEDRTMTVGASIGLVELSHRTESIASLLSAADMACYAAKDGGRNRVHIHDPNSDSARNRELRWVSRLGAGAEDGRLEVVFQPWVVASAGSDVHPHYELFARLRDDDGRLVMPDEFLPAAERYNVMPALDRWIVERALRELVPSRRNGVNRAAYTVSVNLSGSTISDQGFLESLIGLLEEYDPTPDVLCFEISESSAVSNLANTAFLIRELSLRGCRVALDDFGSGLSSFTYLRNLPVNYVKMDGQFVQGVATDDVDRSMVESMVRVASTLGVQVVAERVETQECFDVLRELGVAFAQGYLFGRPTPIAKFPHR